MVSLSAQSVPLTALPVIDIAGLAGGDAAERAAIAGKIGAACRDTGFFYISGHGIPETLIDELVGQGRRFFARPLDEKLASGRHGDIARGYEPMGFQTLDVGTAPDVKEAYDIGPELPPGHAMAGRAGFEANTWPADQPAFAAAATEYFDRMLTLSRLLLGGIGLSLGLDETYFAAFARDPMAIMRLIHYPLQPVRETAQEIGAGAHTDWGALTLLLQDDCGGLQVWDPSQGWLHVMPIPGTFVVNIGDLMARWTNDRYRSTLHRVVNLSGRDRYSLPFFLDGNADYVVSCLPDCSGPGEPAKYPPVTTLAHIEDMHARALTASAKDAQA